VTTTTGSDLDLLRAIEAGAVEAAVAGRVVIEAGPWRALINPTDPAPWQSYAVPARPLESAEEALAGIIELRQAFRQRGHHLRCELIDALWPAAALLLERAGLVFEAAQPVMHCQAAWLRQRHSSAVTVTMLTGESPNELLEAHVRVGRLGFDETFIDGSEHHEVTALRLAIATGKLRCAVGAVDGQVVGVGSLVPMDRGDTAFRGEVFVDISRVPIDGRPITGLGELAGVATLPGFRRLGVASAISGALTSEHFALDGRTVWLAAGSDEAARVYSALGYQVLATRLLYTDV
jgi:ribosomal protein S18 acetylase RimI-like enzyme